MLIMTGASFLFTKNSLAAEGDVLWQDQPSDTWADFPGAIAREIAVGNGAYEGVYVAGNDYIGGDTHDWRVAKYAKAGGPPLWTKEWNLYPSFDDFPQDIKVISEGSNAGVYVAGGCRISGGDPGYWCVQKLDAFGNLIRLERKSIGGRESYIEAMAIGTDGIYLVGHRGAGSGHQWRIEKISFSDLQPVLSFGSNGVILDSTEGRAAYDIAIDSTSIYIVGSMDLGKKWRMEKRDSATGSLVSSFGSNGVQESNPSMWGDRAFGVAIDSGSLFIVGSQGEGGGEWRIEKRSAGDGSLVGSFGVGGVTRDDMTGGDDTPYDIVISSPYIYVAGEYNERWRVQKRDLNSGNLVSLYGTDLPEGLHVATGIAIEGNDIYVSGRKGSGWRVEKRTVSSVAPPVLSISFSAAPTAGCTALSSVLAATRNGSSTTTGPIDYIFDCDGDGSIESEDRVINASSNNSESHTCVYSASSNASATMTQQGVSKSATAAVSISLPVCSPAENTVCQGTPPYNDSCGNINACSGTKICIKSGDWKEVAP